VWVNERLDQAGVASNGNTIHPLLTAASDFMVFDTTIVGVRISSLGISSALTSAVAGVRQVGAALFTAQENIDSADVLDGALGIHIGPPWMWHAMGQFHSTGAAPLQLPLVSSVGTNGVLVKSRRRFKENNSTLFLLLSTDVDAGDASYTATGYFRTLLHIP